jgi:predicted ATPase/DNA-binding winged helix-turn-helix (wHTH) protein
MSSARYCFGPFTLGVPQLDLTRDGAPIKLGGRALNLLAVLVEAEGGLVTRGTLIERVWPKQSIDETAIRVHLSNARKALALETGEPVIVADAGRGYRLALPVTRVAPADAPIVPQERARLPERIGSVVGRNALVPVLADELVSRRFISLVGPGGIGKTTAGLAIARTVVSRLDLDAWFVDLAPVGDGESVAATLAATLDVPGSGSDLIHRVAARLSVAPALIVLDNCEHVIDAAAILAEKLLRSAPSLLLLATSREPLRAEGEWVHRLAALEVPGPEDCDSVERAAMFSATALFAERALAANNEFRLNRGSLPAVIEICRRLDGLPLAIELAAARSDTMAPETIASGLDDRFALLSRGRRTALPRHRTLRGTLDWSYDLLEPPLQDLLDRLGLFRGTFDMEGAAAMAGGVNISSPTAVTMVAELVAKSLVVPVTTTSGSRYRLLETTRQYGIERLSASGAQPEARRDHARFLLRRLSDSAAAWEGKAQREWLAEYSAQIDDVRSAIAWASGGDGHTGDAVLAAELVIAAAPLWFHLSLPAEFLRHAEAAIAVMQGGDVQPARQVELLCAYGHALWHTKGPVPAMADAFGRALALAEAMGSPPLALRASWGVWAQAILAGDYAGSLALAERFDAAVGPDGALGDRQTAAHMLALSHHFSGDHGRAMNALTLVIAGDEAPERANHANHAQVDGKIAVMSLLMRLHWMRGDLPGALAIARECALDAAQIDHALSICYGLSVGCIPVAIAAGEDALAATWIEALDDRTRRYGLDHWQAFVLGYSRALGQQVTMPAWVSGMQADMFAVAVDPQARVPWRREAA